MAGVTGRITHGRWTMGMMEVALIVIAGGFAVAVIALMAMTILHRDYEREQDAEFKRQQTGED